MKKTLMQIVFLIEIIAICVSIVWFVMTGSWSAFLAICTTTGTLIVTSLNWLPLPQKFSSLFRRTKNNQQQLPKGHIIAEFFEEYYKNAGLNIFQRAGIKYPVFYTSCPSEQEQNPNSILDENLIEEQISKNFVIDSKKHFVALEASGLKVRRGTTYVMEKVSISGPDSKIKIRSRLGMYEDMLRTCDVLREETEKVFEKKTWSYANYETLKSKLKLRNKYSQFVANPYLDGKGRSATLGILTLIVFRDEDIEEHKTPTAYRAVLVRRSKLCATYPGYYHVAPSFVFQPSVGFYKEEYDVVLNIYREYMEELFGLPEAESNPGIMYSKWIYHQDEVKDLKSLIDSSDESIKANLYLTGYAMSALDLRPQICTLLIIHDPGWLRRQKFKYNWEWETPKEQLSQGINVLKPIDITQSESEISKILNSIDLIPEAAVAFWLGVDRAKKEIKHLTY
jgi:hypothetical protein